MSRLDRAVIRNVISGNVAFTDEVAKRFADIGRLHLCRNIPTDRWHVIITSGDQIKLSWLAHMCLSIASKYAIHGRAALRERE